MIRGEKNVGLHKHDFCMHDWEVFPNNTRFGLQKKQNICKIDLFYQNKHNHQFFLRRFLSNFLRNSIKYVSKAVSGAFSGALKVAVLRAMAIQSTFSDDSFK